MGLIEDHHQRAALLNQWGFPCQSADKLRMRYFLISSMTSCSMEKGSADTPKCMKMLSLSPKAVLKGRKKATARTSMISVTKEKYMKALEIPWVITDSLRVLQTKKLRTCPQTIPMKYPVWAYLQAYVVKQTGRPVMGEICWMLQVPQVILCENTAFPSVPMLQVSKVILRSYLALSRKNQSTMPVLPSPLGQLVLNFSRQVFPKVGWVGLQTSPGLDLVISTLARPKREAGVKPKSLKTTQQQSMAPQNSIHPWYPQACAISVIVTMWSSLCLGLRVIRSSSPGSQASAMAGMRSVPTEMYSTTTAVRGQGICRTTKAMKGNIWPTWEVSAQQIDFLMLSQIFLPYSMPTTIELKSSFSRIMSAASLATSVPVIPIETPISAFLIAGESLTPSPVTATTSPARWHPLTITNFWAGVVLAKTIWLFVSHFCNFLPCSDSGRPSSSRAICVSMSPWMTTAFDSLKHSSKERPVLSAISLTVSSEMMLHCFAMEAAVTGWSPVTITTFTPAERHLRTAQGTESLGGSARERTPTKQSPLRRSSLSMSKLQSLGYLLLGRWHLAKPSTLSPFLPKVALASKNFFSHSSVLGTGCPPLSMKVHLAQMRSGAPFMKTQKWESSRGQQLTEKAYLLVELKGMRHSLPQESFTTGKRSLMEVMSSMGWKNLMRPDSEASPVVGMSRYFMLFKLYCHSCYNYLIRSSFSSGFRASSFLTALTLSAGRERSKLATEHTTAASWRVLKPGSLGSYSYLQSGPRFCWFSALQSLPLYQIFDAVILFMVRVPVLSEQMQLVAPRVYTASRNLTKTFLLDKIWAVRVSPTVISTTRPQGTLAVMTPMAKMKLRRAEQPMAKPRPKIRAPIPSEKMVNPKINLLISFCRGVCSSSKPAVAAKLAIRPMKVLSPVLMTTPLPVPSRLRVEKKATFLLQSGLSWVHLVPLGKSSVSPVSEELSTFMPCDSMILKSAGIFFPSYTRTKSPQTNLVASNLVSIPLRMTMVSGGIKSLKLSMMDWLFIDWQKLMKLVTKIIETMTIPRQRLLSPPPRPQATKTRIAPAHSSKLKTLTNSFNRRMLQCVPAFYVSLLGPSRSNLATACSLVSPVCRLVSNFFQNSSRGILWSVEIWNFSASCTA